MVALPATQETKMQIQRVNCMVGLRSNEMEDDPSSWVVKAGVGAILVTEIPIFQFMHGADAVKNVKVIGTVETTKKEEMERLRRVHKHKYVNEVYPGRAPRLPQSVGDLDFDGDWEDRRKAKTAAVPDDKAEIRKQLGDMGVEIPSGNHGVAALQAMLEEAKAA